MLGKLIKYDFRCCIRKFGPLWIGLAALAMINGFTIGHVLENDKITGFASFLLGGLPIILLFSLAAAIAAAVLVFVCQRFYTGLLGDEGYLMFTLPVTNAEHIASKLLVAFFLELITMAVAAVSGVLFVLVYRASLLREAIDAAVRYFREYGAEIPGNAWLVLAETALLSLAAMLVSSLHIYLAIALGHLARKNRALWSVGAYIAINIVVSTVGAKFVQIIASLSTPDFLFYFDELGVHGQVNTAAWVISVGLVSVLVQGAIYFFGTKYILDKKLNLE